VSWLKVKSLLKSQKKGFSDVCAGSMAVVRERRLTVDSGVRLVEEALESKFIASCKEASFALCLSNAYRNRQFVF
jgi:hypothetical protein